MPLVGLTSSTEDGSTSTFDGEGGVERKGNSHSHNGAEQGQRLAGGRARAEENRLLLFLQGVDHSVTHFLLRFAPHRTSTWSICPTHGLINPHSLSGHTDSHERIIFHDHPGRSS